MLFRSSFHTQGKTAAEDTYSFHIFANIRIDNASIRFCFSIVERPGCTASEYAGRISIQQVNISAVFIICNRVCPDVFAADIRTIAAVSKSYAAAKHADCRALSYNLVDVNIIQVAIFYCVNDAAQCAADIRRDVVRILTVKVYDDSRFARVGRSFTAAISIVSFMGTFASSITFPCICLRTCRYAASDNADCRRITCQVNIRITRSRRSAAAFDSIINFYFDKHIVRIFIRFKLDTIIDQNSECRRTIVIANLSAFDCFYGSCSINSTSYAASDNPDT